jgi:hypothetical protein
MAERKAETKEGTAIKNPTKDHTVKDKDQTNVEDREYEGSKVPREVKETNKPDA